MGDKLAKKSKQKEIITENKGNKVKEKVNIFENKEVSNKKVTSKDKVKGEIKRKFPKPIAEKVKVYEKKKDKTSASTTDNKPTIAMKKVDISQRRSSIGSNIIIPEREEGEIKEAKKKGSGKEASKEGLEIEEKIDLIDDKDFSEIRKSIKDEGRESVHEEPKEGVEENKINDGNAVNADNEGGAIAVSKRNSRVNAINEINTNSVGEENVEDEYDDVSVLNINEEIEKKRSGGERKHVGWGPEYDMPRVNREGGLAIYEKSDGKSMKAVRAALYNYNRRKKGGEAAELECLQEIHQACVRYISNTWGNIFGFLHFGVSGERLKEVKLLRDEAAAKIRALNARDVLI